MYLPPPMDFEVFSTKPYSKLFLDRGLRSFSQAAEYVMRLPYEEISDIGNPMLVMEEGRGTNGTKHALLKTLSEENYFIGLDLVIGTYLVTAENTPDAEPFLKKLRLKGVPSNHTYLRYGDTPLDFSSEFKRDFHGEIIRELCIDNNRLGGFHERHLENFISIWKTRHDIKYSVEELYELSKKCTASIFEIYRSENSRV